MGTKPTDQTWHRVGVTIYVTSALAFFTQLVGEISGIYVLGAGWVIHEIVSLITLLGFVTGGVLIARSSRKVMARNAEVETHLRTARGELFAVLDQKFDSWELSGAERDVALLTVKGMSVAEIAELRDTSQGTVKSQNNSIYRKAGVKSRTQLLSALIDELLIEP